jgi:anti-sigma factor RsiW
MDCVKRTKSGAETLLDYCSGALEPARTAELERHIENCPECFRAVEAQRELWETLDRWKAPVVSADFNARLYARIARENETPAWRRWMRRLTQPAVPYALWKPAALAAACAALAVGFLVSTPPVMHAPVPASQMETEHVDIEQVANALEELDLLMPPASPAPANANPM